MDASIQIPRASRSSEGPQRRAATAADSGWSDEPRVEWATHSQVNRENGYEPRFSANLMLFFWTSIKSMQFLLRLVDSCVLNNVCLTLLYAMG